MNKLLHATLALLLLSTSAVLTNAAGRSPSSGLPQRSPGLTVEEVVRNSAAEAAGVRPGDRITAVDGQPIGSYADLDAIVAASDGRQLTIDIARGGARIRLKATPRSMAPPDQFSIVQNSKVLGIAHSELRFVLTPDGGDDTDVPFVDGSE